MKHGFTLIEIMIWITITSLVLLWGFSALSAIGVWKVRLIEKTNIEKQGSYFSQKLFEMIKHGGSLDYEQYWNRKIRDNTSYTGWHFATNDGFGNFGANGLPSTNTYGNSHYYCLSWDGWPMPLDSGCVILYNRDSWNAITHSDYSWEPQRYGQYQFQFIDFNHNADNDNGLPGDENGDGSIFGDDDDELLWNGPEVFTTGSEITELYLINKQWDTRTFFRWKVGNDPQAPTGASCDSSDGGQTFSWSGCLATIQFLRLDWKDIGLDHDETLLDTDGSQYDGNIDTWIIDPAFHNQSNDIVAGSSSQDYWQNLFPDTMHVSDFEVYGFPHKDSSLAWQDSSSQTNIAPYIRITLKIQPSWKQRRLLNGSVPTLDLSTSITLNDLYSQ
jgi:hypothetical protein